MTVVYAVAEGVGPLMTDHLREIAARYPTDVPVDVWAPDPDRSMPYLSIEAPAWADDPDGPLCDTPSAFQTRIRVRAVAGTPEGVDILLANARAGLPGRFMVAGRVAGLRWERAEFVGLDTDVTNPGTNRYPAVGVDTYTLTSQSA